MSDIRPPADCLGHAALRDHVEDNDTHRDTNTPQKPSRRAGRVRLRLTRFFIFLTAGVYMITTIMMRNPPAQHAYTTVHRRTEKREHPEENATASDRSWHTLPARSQSG